MNSYVMLSQIRTISSKRLLRKIDSLNIQDFSHIIDKVHSYISKNRGPSNENPLGGRSQ